MRKVTIDLKQQILSPQGEPAKTPKGAPCDLKFILVESCLNEIEGERLSGSAKYHLGALSQLLQSSDTVEVTEDEVAILRRRCGEIFQPLAVKQVWDMLSAAEAKSSSHLKAAEAPAEESK